MATHVESQIIILLDNPESLNTDLDCRIQEVMILKRTTHFSTKKNIIIICDKKN